jgi:sigma54-dependent transcription regulator
VRTNNIVCSPQSRLTCCLLHTLLRGALSQYALVSKELLQARYASTFEKNGSVSATPAVTKNGLSEELSRDVLTAGLSRRPILLVGEVGVGKSIFIRHLIKIDAKEAFERAFVLYIDFGSKPALAGDLRPYVVTP